MERLVAWTGLDLWLVEAASVDLTASGVRAHGTQLGAEPVLYRLEYDLDAADGFVTRSLHVEARGDGWSRRARLSHDGEGGWRCETEQEGDVDLPPAGGDVDELRGALRLRPRPVAADEPDARSPARAARAAGLRRAPHGMVAVPDLGLRAYPQRYEHLRADARGAVVRFASLGIDEGFVADLELDRDGLVVCYPQLARRVGS